MKSLKAKLHKFLGLKTIQQLTRFLIIGCIATIISYSVFLICLRIFGIHYLIANIISFVAGISAGYPLNKIWTFKSDSQKKFHHYLAVYLTSLFISLIFLKITVDFIGIIPEIAILLSLVITTCTNFVGTKFLVFKK